VIEAVVVDEYQHVFDASIVYADHGGVADMNGHSTIGGISHDQREKRIFSVRESNWCGCNRWTWAAFGLLTCFIVAMVIMAIVLALLTMPPSEMMTDDSYPATEQPIATALPVSSP
jgi:hypothetical protein